MSDRFASEKTAFLSDDRSAAVNPERPAGRPTTEQIQTVGSGPRWELDGVAVLVNPGQASPLLLRASGALLKVAEGRKLRSQLIEITRKGLLIRVEGFSTEAELAARRESLTHSTANISAEDTMNGFTDPFRVPNGFLFDLDERTRKPKGFNVLVRAPRSTLEKTGNDRQETPGSAFDFLRASTTLFHEFLHVLFIYEHVDFENDTISATTRDGFTVEDVHDTGHQQTFFTLNPSTLRIDIDGEVEQDFGARITSFVDQMVAKFDLRGAGSAARRRNRPQAGGRDR